MAGGNKYKGKGGIDEMVKNTTKVIASPKEEIVNEEKRISKAIFILPSLFKKLKLQALEEDCFDYEIVEKALNLYFEGKEK